MNGPDKMTNQTFGLRTEKVTLTKDRIESADVVFGQRFDFELDELVTQYAEDAR